MSNGVDQLKAYSEACNTLRHYSNASLAVRSASVVQGLAIMFPWAYALTKSHPRAFYAFALPIAGLLFTALLYRFHLGYFRATAFFYDVAARMEQKFFDEDCRPITAYNIWKAELYEGAWARFTILYAPFTLIGLLFVAALIADVVIFVYCPASNCRFCPNN
jgi:hypothetical protein